MTAHDTTARARAIILLRRGLVTQAEAAWLAGVSRSHVAYWVRAAELDPLAARAAHLRALWQSPLGR